MADFHGHQLTDAGRNLLAKILAGDKVLKYTKMVAGDGQLGSQPISSLTSVISPRLEFSISQTPTRNSTGRWNVTSIFSNKNLQSPFYFREWAVFAQDPDTQQDVLMLYANAGSTADLIPVWDGSQESTLIEQQLTCACVVDSEIAVTALIDPSQIYVPESEFLAHKNNKDNPHGVNPNQIGAETPAGAQEKADAAKAEAIAASDPKGSAAAVSSGITNGTIKAASAAAADTAAKLAAKRTIALSGGATGTATGFDGSGNISIPVTALDMSKATAGTLPVARGGSGLTAAPSLLVNLASTTAAGIFTASPRPGVTGTLPVARGGTGATSLGSITVGNASKWGSYSIWKGTQAQYNALSSKSGTTLYFIVG